MSVEPTPVIKHVEENGREGLRPRCGQRILERGREKETLRKKKMDKMDLVKIINLCSAGNGVENLKTKTAGRAKDAGDPRLTESLCPGCGKSSELGEEKVDALQKWY